MTAAELIKELQVIPPKTQIRVWADHGQMCMMASTSGLAKIRKSDLKEYSCDTVSDEEAEEGGLGKLVDIFEIGAP